MNIISAVKNYITKITEESEPGMKILLMDKDTTSIISMVYGQSEILQKEVYLLERIDTSQPLNPDRDSGLRYLKCLVFLRPSAENIALLSRELRNPKYGAYYIYFSNILAKADVKTLAESDEQEVVKDLQEYYMDYLAINQHLFSVGLTGGCLKGLSWQPQALLRTTQALSAVLLSLKCSPLVRYQRNSGNCRRLADNIRDFIIKEQRMFDFRQSSPAVLLIVDRKDDVITPLLTQWTYQAMVHELMGIQNNRVSLDSKELSEVVLTAEQDAFYAKNLYLNFGEIGQNIKKMMEDFQQKAKNNLKVESIQDMKQFVENYPQFKKMSGNVSKHVTVVGELSAIISQNNLLEISELEQELTSHNEHSNQLQTIRRLINQSNVTNSDSVRLVSIYAIRYQNHPQNDIINLLELLKKKGVPDNQINSIVSVLEYGGAQARQSDLFDFESAAKITKRFFKGLNGVDNVYTQHKPLLQETLDDLLKNKLKETHFPYLGEQQLQGRPQDVIVFYVGGTTYEESLTVHNFNRNYSQGVRVVLGGTTVHNSRSFFDEVHAALRGESRKYTRNIRNVPLKVE